MRNKLFLLLTLAWIAPVSLTPMMTSSAICDYCNPPCQTDFDACMSAQLPLTTCIEQAESCTCPSPKPKPKTYHHPKKSQINANISSPGLAIPLQD